MTWAVVALNVAGLAAFGWVLLAVRGLEAEIAKLCRSSRSTRKEVANLHRDFAGGLDAVTAHAIWVRQQLADDGRVTVNLRMLNERIAAGNRRTSEQMQRGFARAIRDMERANAALQSLPATTVELSRMYQQLVKQDRVMPAPDGHWAPTARTLVWLLDHIAAGQVSRILECGSGASTVWFAAALEEQGEGHVFALESDPRYAEETRSNLDRLGLRHRADVLDAPLIDSAVNGRDARPWYNISGLPEAATEIDLLFVDGPVGTLAPEVRYPAFPLLADRLAANAVVVLDDTIRPDEANFVESWLTEEHAGRRLERICLTDRSTIMRAVPSQMIVEALGAGMSMAVGRGCWLGRAWPAS
jgi:predicted O-methyltransferase YrrM